MDPLERAQVLLLLAKATTTLFALRLRCKGVNPDDHPVRREFERLSLYQEKLQQCMDLNKAPLRPSVTINPKAAARFIEHSLPDLSSEQRQSMRKISQGVDQRINYLDKNLQKKRKFQSSERQSVRTAAQEFLEKAARELLGNNKNGVKGPFQPEDSDDDVIILD
ncbi:Sas10/Utp3/C1D family [Striga hermonthica]|uniref:Nuclear nucleic acid-binding protein C1D n=1 Tax=Striga hermonthica TaxID=68872 RepID=A0A9N7RF55_STRHE|nr:Sas10/Utp3/C1D family [Striga hermonthica]